MQTSNMRQSIVTHQDTGGDLDGPFPLMYGHIAIEARQFKKTLLL
jgi:hypothetical protein